jgi:hypothetical protein
MADGCWGCVTSMWWLLAGLAASTVSGQAWLLLLVKSVSEPSPSSVSPQDLVYTALALHRFAYG